MLGKGASSGKAGNVPMQRNSKTEALLTLHTVMPGLWQKNKYLQVAQLSGWHNKLQQRMVTRIRYLIWSICLCSQCKRNLCLQILGQWSACIQQKAMGLVHTHAGCLIKLGAITFEHQ